jgi:hypothetical protein
MKLLSSSDEVNAMERDDMRELYSHMEAIERLLGRGDRGGERERGGYEREQRMGDRSGGRGQELSRSGDRGRDDRDRSGRGDRGGRFSERETIGGRGFGMREGWGDEERRIVDAIVEGVVEKVTQRILTEMERRFPALTQPPEGYVPSGPSRPDDDERGVSRDGGREQRQMSRRDEGQRRDQGDRDRSNDGGSRSGRERDHRSNDRGDYRRNEGGYGPS